MPTKPKVAEEFKDEPAWGGDGETVREVEDAEPETVDHLVLSLDGDEQAFPARRNANQYLLVKYADDLAAGGFFTVRAVTALALAQVLPSERLRLEGYLFEHGSADDYCDSLYACLEKTWAGETMLPLAPSSDS